MVDEVERPTVESAKNGATEMQPLDARAPTFPHQGGRRSRAAVVAAFPDPAVEGEPPKKITTAKIYRNLGHLFLAGGALIGLLSKKYRWRGGLPCVLVAGYFYYKSVSRDANRSEQPDPDRSWLEDDPPRFSFGRSPDAAPPDRSWLEDGPPRFPSGQSTFGASQDRSWLEDGPPRFPSGQSTFGDSLVGLAQARQASRAAEARCAEAVREADVYLAEKKADLEALRKADALKKRLGALAEKEKKKLDNLEGKIRRVYTEIAEEFNAQREPQPLPFRWRDQEIELFAHIYREKLPENSPIWDEIEAARQSVLSIDERVRYEVQQHWVFGQSKSPDFNDQQKFLRVFGYTWYHYVKSGTLTYQAYQVPSFG